MGDVSIYTELGRWLCPWAALVTRVLHQKETYRHAWRVDACAANLIVRPCTHDAYHHRRYGQEDAPATHTYNALWGVGLCENNDQFGKESPDSQRWLWVISLFIHDTGTWFLDGP